MISGREGQERVIPISQEIIAQQAASTIKTLVDAIVEVVTNSDDSYRRLEQAGHETKGDIDILVRRRAGGKCEVLQVRDDAEGMSLSNLEASIEFGTDTSGFLQGRTVRGLFGKGLKEAILALGDGEITAIKEGKESAISVWRDQDSRKNMYRIIKDSRDVDTSNGTSVFINVHNEKIKSPGFDPLYTSIARHFALRDINKDPRRHLRLTVNDVRIKRSRPIKYSAPGGELCLSIDIRLSELGTASVRIYEAPEKLEFAPYDTSSEAGILIKSDGVILDNRLFGFESEEAAHFFFGWIDCPGIAEAIRHGDRAIVDPSRSGLDWRYHLCRDLNNEIQKLLKPLVDRKRRDLELTRKTTVKAKYKEKLGALCSLLNQLAQDELDELTGPWRTPAEIDWLAIRPDVGYSEPGRPRTFSVYIPKKLVEASGYEQLVALDLTDVVGEVELVESSTVLSMHPVYNELLMGHFRIVGKNDGESAYIIARINKFEDIAEFRVKQPGHRRKGRPIRRTGGLFERIEFDDKTPDPIQRVSFVGGVITVFLDFAPIKSYLGPGGEGMDSQHGSLMLAELVAEAFCTELARRRIEAGIVPIVAGGEIDGYRSEVNKLMRKYLKHIHKVLVSSYRI